MLMEVDDLLIPLLDSSDNILPVFADGLLGIFTNQLELPTISDDLLDTLSKNLGIVQRCITVVVICDLFSSVGAFNDDRWRLDSGCFLNDDSTGVIEGREEEEKGKEKNDTVNKPAREP